MRDPRLDAISEKEWQATVLDHAQRAGWLRYYIPDDMWKRAFRKSANGKQYGQKLGDKGFPDLVLLRAGRLIFRELKKMGGTLQPEQKVWRDELLNAGADWKLWRPSDLDDVIADLWEGRAQ